MSRRIALILAAVILVGCSTAMRSNAPAAVLARQLRDRELKIEPRSINGRQILFSNVGAIFYPEAVTGVIVPILVYRNLEGAWPNLGTQIEGSGFTADVRFAGPLLVLTVTESELKQYEIFLDSNLMASVRDGTEELLQRYVALLQGRKPFDVFPVFPATL